MAGINNVFSTLRQACSQLNLLTWPDSFQELASRPRLLLLVDDKKFLLCAGVSVALPVSSKSTAWCFLLSDAMFQVKAGEEIFISFPLSRCFRHSVEVTGGAMGKAGAIVALEAAVATPFSPDQVYAGWYRGPPPSDDPDAEKVQHIIVRRDLVKPIAEAIEAKGGKLGGILVRDGQERHLPLVISVEDIPFGFKALKRHRHFVAAAFAGVLICAAALPWSISRHQVQALERIDDRTAALRDDAEFVRQKLDSAKKLSASATSLEKRLNSRRNVSVLLETLSKLMPDTAYLTALSLDRKAISVEGMAVEPERLISELEASMEFQSVAFSAAVMKNPGDIASRFSISAELEAFRQEVKQ
jgi:general secretion pathway protein L